MSKQLTKKELADIEQFRSRFPKEIPVEVSSAEEGGFCASVHVNGDVLYTDGETISELIDMINDAVRTYFEIPSELISFMPEYLPPIEMAQKFGMYPQTFKIPLLEPALN